jgi:hypothetical protein
MCTCAGIMSNTAEQCSMEINGTVISRVACVLDPADS